MIASYGVILISIGFLIAMLLPTMSRGNYNPRDWLAVAPIFVGTLMFGASLVASIGRWMWSNMI